MNGSGSVKRLRSTETRRSLIASSRADWVFGVARLISSARTTLAKSGPGTNSKICVFWLKIDTPMMSEGRRSLVNWMRWKARPSERARAWARVVLPTPGTSSTSTCPLASRQTVARRMTSRLPRITRATLSSSRPMGSAAAAASVVSKGGAVTGSITACTLAGRRAFCDLLGEEVVLEDRADGREAVLPADLLALGVGAPAVGDGHLPDARPGFVHLGGQLRLDAEAVGLQPQLLQHLPAEGL